MRLYAGIDPGLFGALAIIDGKAQCLYASPLPTRAGTKGRKDLDAQALHHTLAHWGPQLAGVALERVAAFPGQGVSGVFKFGMIYGALEALLLGLGIVPVKPLPREWQKHTHPPHLRQRDPKERSLAAVKLLFPGAPLLATPRAKKPHSGIVDALLLAEYARMQRAWQGVKNTEKA